MGQGVETFKVTLQIKFFFSRVAKELHIYLYDYRQDILY